MFKDKEMTWKKFSEEKPREGQLINIREYHPLSEYEYSYSVGKYLTKNFGGYILPEPVDDNDCEWQEVEE